MNDKQVKSLIKKGQHFSALKLRENKLTAYKLLFLKTAYILFLDKTAYTLFWWLA